MGLDGSERINWIAGQIIGAAIRVRRRLGPGLLEQCYGRRLAHELGKLGLHVQCDPNQFQREPFFPTAWRDSSTIC